MIQPLSYIHPQAIIGKNVNIGPFTTISENVVIGEGTSIGPHVTILPGARIGKYCQIFSGAVIAAIPQDLKFKGEDTLVIIGDYTTIREYVTISRGTVAGPNTIIGNHVLLMSYVHIAHDCIIQDYCILANSVQIAGHVEIGTHVKIGGIAALKQFVKVGNYAMIGGGSLVRKDVPPFVKVAREPIKYCGLNVIGLKRDGFTTKQLQTIQLIYKYIFQEELLLVQAIQQIEQNISPCLERETVLNFIKNTNLGIVKNVGNFIADYEIE